MSLYVNRTYYIPQSQNAQTAMEEWKKLYAREMHYQHKQRYTAQEIGCAPSKGCAKVCYKSLGILCCFGSMLSCYFGECPCGAALAFSTGIVYCRHDELFEEERARQKIIDLWNTRPGEFQSVVRPLDPRFCLVLS